MVFWCLVLMMVGRYNQCVVWGGVLLACFRVWLSFACSWCRCVTLIFRSCFAPFFRSCFPLSPANNNKN